MISDEDRSVERSAANQRFQTTHWSVVLTAGRGESPDAAKALETLCTTYWMPLYAYVRRQGHDSEHAADLIQGFFAELLQREDLRTVDPQKGRFRAFLLASLKHFVSNQRAFQKAQNRGGQVKTLSFDFAGADERFRLEPFHLHTAESAFQKEWALTLLDRARMAIRHEYATSGRGELFEALQGFLTGDLPDDSYREIAQNLNKTEGSVKVAIHRLRQRFHRQIREEIAQTVNSEAEIDGEIQELFEALRGEKSQ